MASERRVLESKRELGNAYRGDTTLSFELNAKLKETKLQKKQWYVAHIVWLKTVSSAFQNLQFDEPL